MAGHQDAMFDAEKLPWSMYSLIVQAVPQALLVSSWIMKPVCSPNPDGSAPELVFAFATTTVPFKVMV